MHALVIHKYIKDNAKLHNITNRLTCDDVISGHGRTFLDFLYDNDTCILNGRFGCKSNTFTSISTRGKAVVDYVFITHEHFKFVQNFKVITMNEINDLYMKHVNNICRFPDQNVLCVTVYMSYCIDVSHVNKGSDDLDLDVNNINYPERKTDYETKMIKYKYENMTKTFMNNKKCINNAKDCHNIL